MASLKRDTGYMHGVRPHLRMVGAMVSVLMAASAISTAAAADAPPAGAIVTVPSEIKWEECWGAPPGGKCAAMAGDHSKSGLFAHRISLPADYDMPPHIHPTDEQVIVLEGVYHAGFGETLDKSKSVALPAGSFLLIPKGAAHFAWTDGPVVVQVYAEGPWGMTPATSKEPDDASPH